MEVNLAWLTEPPLEAAPGSRRVAASPLCALIVRVEPPAPESDSAVEVKNEFVEFSPSVLELATGPHAASNDCQPERKSCPAVAFEAEKMDEAPPAERMPEPAP